MELEGIFTCRFSDCNSLKFDSRSSSTRRKTNFRTKWMICCRGKNNSRTTSITTVTDHDTPITKRDSLFIDKRGKLRSFDHKKLSRKKGGTLRGRGWKYGTGFVDGVFPVMSPTGQQLLNYLQNYNEAQLEDGISTIWNTLDSLSPTHTTWDDIINVIVQLRLNKQWDPTIMVCEWILYRSSFQPDIMCYNLLIDSYGHKSQYKKAESIYLQLMDARIVPNEDTYALLLRAYCSSGLLDKAEAVFSEMQKYGLPPRINLS
ncbi:hypothetical protein MKW98_010136 [Papaver atlanticum]|uniref:Pentatricopeptide repeat-containing protein n=1 Tax=Papaver atlanticum TaxID=357466 RepID=A0AAD4RXJ0_9MAGN|nr:hypothetical protein MKW98_010136 [Papaver atlanticum]